MFARYAPLAVALGQMSWATVMAHISTVSRMAEEERGAKRPQVLAFLYEAMQRESWARRALQRDSTLNIQAEAAKTDRSVLEAARIRLELVAPSQGMSSGPPSDGLVAAESALARSTAAATAMQKKAEAAARSLEASQRNLAARERAMGSSARSAGSASGSGGGRGPPSRTPRNEKRQRWFADKVRGRASKRSNTWDY